MNYRRRFSSAAFVTLIPLVASFVVYGYLPPVHWVNEPIHSSLEASASLIALVLGLLLLRARSYAVDNRRHYIPIANSMLCSGFLYGFHGIMPPGPGFYWTRALATAVGGLSLLAVWLTPKDPLPRDARLLSPWFLGTAAFLLGVFCFLFPNLLPPLTDSSGDFTWLAKSVNLIGGCAYFGAGLYFFARYLRNSLPEDLTFLAQCSLLGTSGLLFAFSTLWDLTWWLFHLLGFFSYLIVLRNIFMLFNRVQAGFVASNRALEESNRALTAANQELESFSYSISHDLRSPLRGIHGFSEALAQDYAEVLDDRGKKYLAFIQEGVKKMGVLIDDILSLSRINRAELVRTEVNLSAVAEEILARLRKEAPGDSARIVTEIEPDIRLECDPGLATIILENLLGNAWKFSNKIENPRIAFGITRAHEGNGERNILFVKDNGAGFDMAYYDKLFGVFQRLHAARDFSGTGIGLATVKRAVHRLGGTVWAESKPGHGATFFFTLSNT